MDYLLDNLGPERFQEFCQALLVKAFPKTQCFPVGQRDGGRDALSLFPERGADQFVVYQVKFVRKPLAVSEPHKWLLKILEAEAPKVKELIPQGAKEYYLLTNVPGTAYLESGSIDSVQKILNEELDIPAQCWWRDDINRRLDDAWNIKWSYPELLTGTDILRLILENGLTEDAERRTAAIRTFIRDQFNRDTEVRFKQVELQNKLLDLFIDVPVSIREPIAGRRMAHDDMYALHSIMREHRNPITSNSQEPVLGAASLLLHPLAQEYLSKVVLEGAPGQGKSTIVQYICQIHRRRLLNEGVNDSRIPETHLKNPVRLPFKIDCRDLALWLNKRNPFAAENVGTTVPLNWAKSVESFLAAQITQYSGGSLFSVADLHAVVRLSAVVIVFDGLDEVADIGRRREVVDEIEKCASRLREVAVSLQSIVTSRPAAFANSPGLSENNFRYFQLASINRQLIDQYADKWLKARRLEGKEASEVRQILKTKLDQPHLRELARNPMQLAILLSLIHTRGVSLPDKRTALYDSYVELFFNREAEKSSVVRDNRDLLIDIHRYIAWTLHSEAQTKQQRGSVSGDRLRQLVETYLSDEGHNSDLADNLFTGMVERVVALVSRVEGTYEFEVQPLREYFAARYLYNTAPYSPSGNERRGTLPDRFDALARDFFWQNVTRFYAGCYSRGELPSLVLCLEELSKAPGYKDTSHPELLGATLLSDWVFTQYPKLLKGVVALILDGKGIRQITIRSGRPRRGEEPLILPQQCGNDELVRRCFELLRSEPPPDFTSMLLELIRANAMPSKRLEMWVRETQFMTGARRTHWLDHALHLGVLSQLESSQLEELLREEYDVSQRLNMIFRSGQVKFVEASEERFTAMVEYALNGNAELVFRRNASIVDIFVEMLSSYRYAVAFQNRQPRPLSSILEMYPFLGRTEERPSLAEVPEFDIAQRCQQFVRLCVKLSERRATDWASQLNPWDTLVEAGRGLFGDRWAFCLLATTAAGIRSKDKGGEDAVTLCDADQSLCRRARYARLRAGVANWWEAQLADTASEFDLAFTLLVLVNWGGPTVLQKLVQLIDKKLASLTVEWWTKLSKSLQLGVYPFRRERNGIEIDVGMLPENLSERTVAVLASRVSEKTAEGLFNKYLRDYDGQDTSVLELCQWVALQVAQREPETWRRWLPIISRSYTKGAISDRYYGHRFTRAVQSQMLPKEIAEEIVDQCDAYPTELVGWAEQVCREHLSENIKAVGIIAEEQRWFR